MVTEYGVVESIELYPGGSGSPVNLGTILGGVNMITTVVCMRAPGMPCVIVSEQAGVISS